MVVVDLGWWWVGVGLIFNSIHAEFPFISFHFISFHFISFLETHSDEAQSSSSVLAVTNQQPKEEQEEEPPRYNKVGF